jgi:hypothetical protein
MARARLTWVIVGGIVAVLLAGTVDAVRSSEPEAVPALERSPARETTFTVDARESLPRCTVQHIGVSIEVLGGAAQIVVRHVWGSPCHLAPLAVRLLVSDRVGRRVRLASLDEGPPVQSHVAGDFSPGFEQLIDIPYLAEPQLGDCDRAGPFTAFVIVGPYSAQRKLSGSEVDCFRGG